jgi:5-methylcytosine-specific restriction enzyme A
MVRAAKLATLTPRIGIADLRSIPAAPKQADPHYATPEHRAWRAKVIARADGRCQWPGCSRKERRMFADHIVEVKDDRDLALDPSNGWCLCGKHHTLKTNQARQARLDGPRG